MAAKLQGSVDQDEQVRAFVTHRAASTLEGPSRRRLYWVPATATTATTRATTAIATTATATAPTTATATTAARTATTTAAPTPNAPLLRHYFLETSAGLRLSTMLGPCYRAAHAQRRHCTPDWKLHFSVCPEDTPTAWDCIALLFVKRGCLSCLECLSAESNSNSNNSSNSNSNSNIKNNNINNNNSSPTNPNPTNSSSSRVGREPACVGRGREISVDIYRYQDRFARGGADKFADTSEDGAENARELVLSRNFEQPASFWREWVREVETALQAAGVRSHGLAEGDLRFSPDSAFCSLRNEAFVTLTNAQLAKLPKDERSHHAEQLRRWQGLTCPPNNLGYNAGGHSDPFMASSGFAGSLWGLPPAAGFILALAMVAACNFSLLAVLERHGIL